MDGKEKNKLRTRMFYNFFKMLNDEEKIRYREFCVEFKKTHLKEYYKSVRNEKASRYYMNNKNKYFEYQKKYYEKNKTNQKYKEKYKEYYEKYKERYKEYYEKNKEKIKVLNLKYYHENKSYEKNKEYYDKHKNKISKYFYDYYHYKKYNILKNRSLLCGKEYRKQLNNKIYVYDNKNYLIDTMILNLGYSK